MSTTPAPTSTPERLSLPVDNAVEELLLWRNPAKSGAVVGGVTALYILLVWSNRSLVSLVSLAAALVVATFTVWAYLAVWLNRAGPPVPRLLREGISESQAKSLVESYTPMINKGLALVYRTLTGKDPVLSVKAIFLLFIISKLGKVFSVLTWAFVVLLVAFSAPKLYEHKKREIDDAVATGHARTKQLYDQHVAPHVAKIPRASSATPARPSRPVSTDELKQS